MELSEQEDIIHHTAEALEALKKMKIHIEQLEKYAEKYPYKEEEFLKQFSSKNAKKFRSLSIELAALANKLFGV